MNSATCFLCGQEDESVEHMLLGCDWTRGIWLSICGLRIYHESLSTFDQWLSQVILNDDNLLGVKEDLVRKIAFTCWGIWKARCERVLTDSQDLGYRTVNRIQQALEEWMRVKDRLEPKHDSVDGRTVSDDLWQKPDEGWFKVNCDGAFCNNSCVAGIGIVVRDSEGIVLESYGKCIKAGNALVAEAVAVKEAVQVTRHMGLEQVIIETDCSNIHSNIKSNTVVDWRIKPLVLDIGHLLRELPNVELRVIKRSANIAADWFAKQARKEMCFVDGRLHHPSSLVGIWSSDGVAAPP
ncbi:hypothetical protein COLO4_20392 [Corchorus olitorius]|uniref:RNase H type-1 domain-containing protein n=1 Tax=Corchorus olitorius TaxID=93759 RepID=A0A1R3IZZ8_9ROSI|nr:hypothetical protein COLO4_20392 [Corchorus olitorius]